MWTGDGSQWPVSRELSRFSLLAAFEGFQSLLMVGRCGFSLCCAFAFLVLLTHKWGLGHRVGAGPGGGGSAVSRFDGRTNSSILRGPLTKIGLKRTIFFGQILVIFSKFGQVQRSTPPNMSKPTLEHFGNPIVTHLKPGPNGCFWWRGD